MNRPIPRFGGCALARGWGGAGPRDGLQLYAAQGVIIVRCHDSCLQELCVQRGGGGISL